MLKSLKTVKVIETEILDAVRDLVCDVPRVQLNSVVPSARIGKNHEVDGKVEFSLNDSLYSLIVEVKANGAPRYVRSGVHVLESNISRLRRDQHGDVHKHFIPILVSPYLSPQSREICTDNDVAYMDLVGNARLVFDTVYIERAVAERPVTESRALRSLFTPKAAAILRVLLRQPDRAWRVAELAREANASYGHVSNVRKALLEREWLEVRPDGVALVQPKELVHMWRESYRRPKSESISGYTTYHGDRFVDRLKNTLKSNSDRPRAVYSLHSAAQWLAPFGRVATQTLYVDEVGAELVKDTLKLTRGGRGANVVLSVLEDDNLLFDSIEPTPNVFCTSPTLTYLDLWAGSDRDQEAARHLAQECLPWLK